MRERSDETASSRPLATMSPTGVGGKLRPVQEHARQSARMEDVDFDQVLAILLSWVGRPVAIGLEAGSLPLEVVRMRGVLMGVPSVTDPYDSEYEFRVNAEPEAGFELHRDCFTGGDYFPDSGRLILSVGDAELGAAPTDAMLHIVVQGDG